jgi:hypothetical protein
LDNLLQATDLPALPALDGSRFKPPDPGEDVGGAHKVPGRQRPFGCCGDAIAKWNLILM